MLEVKDLSIIKEILKWADNVLVSGPPGVGKSEIIKSIIKEMDLKYIEARPYEQGESAAGLPRVQEEENVTYFTRPFWIKDVIESNAQVLLLEDFHLVPENLQAYFYKLLPDKQLHNYKLRDDLKIFALGNFKIDSASAAAIQAPIMTRFHIALEYLPSANLWIKYALAKGFHPSVIGFVQANPDLLFTREPDTSCMYPCPRTWEYLSRCLNKTGNASLAPGVVGAETGYKFIEFHELVQVPFEEIKKQVSSKSSIKDQVIASLIAAREYMTSDPKNKVEIINFVTRLNNECQVLFARSASRMDPLKFINEIQETSSELYKTLLQVADYLFKMGK